MPDSSISASCAVYSGASSYLGQAYIIGEDRGQLVRANHVKHFKCLLESHLLTLHWLKQVTWLSPTKWENLLPQEWGRESKYSLNNNIINHSLAK